MAEKPAVSIIMPTFNGAARLPASLGSVRDQTFADFELIVIDDASTDNSRDVVKETAAGDPRIRLVALARNVGAGAARNAGIEAARGRYIAFLDSDDRWHREKLARQISWMQAAGIGFSCTAYERVDEARGQRVVFGVPERASRRDMLKCNTVGTLTAVYDTEFYGKRLMSSIRRRQDYALWLDLLSDGSLVHGLDEPLAWYHHGHQSVSSNKLKAARDTWIMFRGPARLSPLEAGWYFAHYAVNSMLRTKLPSLARQVGRL